MPASQASTDVRLPRAVLQRSAAIQARIDARTAESKTEPPAGDPPANPPASAPEPSPNPPPAAANSAPPQPSPPADPRENDPAYWRQRFKVTSGLLDSERTAHRDTRQQMGARIAELETQVASLHASAAPAPSPTADLSRYFTPEEIEKYGEEQCRAMVRIGETAAQERVKAQVEAQVKPLRDRQEQTQKDEAERRKTEFWDKLAELRPDFREVDESPNWRAWLAEEDPNTGLQRQQALNFHLQRLNPQAVANMFNLYARSTTPPAPPTPPVAPTGTAAPAADAAPTPAQAGAPGAPSAAEVRDFYKRAALGKVSETERAAFEARMSARFGRP